MSTEGTAITGELVRGMAPVRDDRCHKNDFGHLLIIAGSEFMTGALQLCCASALRSGIGLVTAFSTREALVPLKASTPCALTAAWEDSVTATLRKADELMKKASAVAIGPGLDESDPRSKALVEEVLNTAHALVLDAGALNIIAKNREELLPVLASRKARGLLPAVLTPHIGEMRRLLKGEVTPEVCAKFAVDNACLLVLKDNKTLIYTPHDTWYSIQGDNSGMAKGGSGDVLTGLTAGFLAQGVKPCNAGVAAVYMHSKAGVLAAEALGKRCMLPTDVIGTLSQVFRETGW
ncbi:MAG: NAD(P)H-hydrate dehydratase [Clostridiales bacterium]|nr:NAD(P)H-hydrate dehydratase [Clostridiales bacterium]